MKQGIGFRPGYWTFQLAGWSSLLFLHLLLTYFEGRPDGRMVIRMTAAVLIFIASSHSMRLMIHHSRLPVWAPVYRLPGVLLVSIVSALFSSIMVFGVIEVLKLREVSEIRLDDTVFFLRIFFNSLFFHLLWNAIYFMHHYLVKSALHEIDTVRMDARLKSMDLKNINSYINPHFVFNTLNGIRALVDEEPAWARSALTSLGNMLSSSMRLAQEDTVTLKQELEIVRDYLSLQQIRFEERLQVEYEIDDETLNHPVPILMLQTLVENAVKHGITRNVKGGLVRIVSRMNESRLELMVENTGSMNPDSQRKGFGFNSTSGRLALIYDDAASFSIRETGENTVEALVCIPGHRPSFKVDSSGRIRHRKSIFKLGGT